VKDPVTGLFDRQQFLHMLEREINDANEHGIKTGLLVADLRAFSRINQVHGYAAGDQVLQAFADVLNQVCRSQDEAARIGDNRFALLLPGIMNRGHAELAAFKIQRLLDVPVQLDHETIPCTANIGIALCPEHGTGPDIVLKEAEQALLQARKTEQPVCTAETRNDDMISDVWDIELELEHSIKDSCLHAFMQPKVSLATGKPVGAEALVRWESPSRGLCPPIFFFR
jgi:diguanylate cyclase (GGDEF)-like protein